MFGGTVEKELSSTAPRWEFVGAGCPGHDTPRLPGCKGMPSCHAEGSPDAPPDLGILNQNSRSSLER